MLLFLLEGTLSLRFFVLVCLFLVVKTNKNKTKKLFKNLVRRNKLTLFGIGHQEPWSRVVCTGEENELGEKEL